MLTADQTIISMFFLQMLYTLKHKDHL